MTDPLADGPLDLAWHDDRIRVLETELQQAHEAFEVAATRLSEARARRARVARRLDAQRPTPSVVVGPAAERPSVPSTPSTPSAPSAPLVTVQGPAATGPESSTRTVQNVLFILGGLLLGTAAIVFTAVAWATYGVTGRATILAALTAVALAAPVVALRRRLTATAETFAAVGLLLVALDGYAAWYVNLFGVAGGDGLRYAGLVALVTAGVAAGYGRLTGLVGPRVAAVLAVQPVVPLLAAALHPDAAGWSLVAAAAAVLDLVLVTLRRSGPGIAAVRGVGWLGYGVALAIGTATAALAETQARTGDQAGLAGLAVGCLAALAVAGAHRSGDDQLRRVAAGAAIVAVSTAGGVYVVTVWPDHALVGVAGVVALAAALAAGIGRLPRNITGAAALRSGATAGAGLAVCVLGLAVALLTLDTALATLRRAQPAWHADLLRTPPTDWQLLAAIALAGLAAHIVTRRAMVLPLAGLLAAFALPGSIALPWWAPSVVDLVAAAVLIVVAVLPRPSVRTEPAVETGPAVATRPAVAMAPAVAIVAAVLGTHAVLASLARPANTAAILAGIVVAGAFAAGLARVRGADQRVAGWSLAVALSAVPPAVGAALVAADRAGALDLRPGWLARATVGAVALGIPALLAVRRWLPTLTGYGFAAVLAAAAFWPLLVVVFDVHEPRGVYGGVSLLLVATALLPMMSTVESDRRSGTTTAAAAAGLPGAVLVAGGVLPVLLVVLGGPYRWLESVWTGAPAGLGLSPASSADLSAAGLAAWSLGLLALASAVASYAVARRVSAAIGGLGLGGPTAIVLGCVAADLRWPTVAAVMLLLGLAVLAGAAVAPLGPVRTGVATVQGLLYTGAGLASLLAEKWSTIAGLASTVVVVAVIGAVGRTLVWRIAGWLGAVAAALGLAATVGLAADLAVRDTAPGVLGVATAALALGAVLQRPRPLEARAVSAAAQAAAVVAALLTAGSLAYAAGISAAWGVMVGLRAIWPDTGRTQRAGFAAIAGGWELVAWWLLLADRGVSAVEAYTVPLAAVGLLAGSAALRARPDLRSWVSYGPALAAGLLPSLALVLSGGGTPLRRLLLGAAALAIVVAGSIRRRQAPVVAGGTVVAVVALHEIAEFWDLLPRWIPLGIGGLLLVALAITYERRRRDLARLRNALGRMT